MKKNYLFFILSLMILPLYLEATVTRIMPLGDSITYDDSYADYDTYSRPASVRHAYRNYLWYRLRDARYEANFVGSRVAGTAIVPSFDPENEGWPGQTSDYIANIIYSKLVQNPADIILLHIGTNDRWAIDASGNHMSGMQNIFDEIDRFERNYNHHVKIILALIIGRRYNDYASFTDTFNANLNALARQRIAQGDDIYIIDMQHNAGLNYSTDFRDPAHPTDTGYSKMANLWYNAVRPYLDIAALPIPTTPTNFTETQLSDNEVRLSWSDNASNELGYRIYRNNVLIATLPANSTSYTITNLEAGSTYTYQLVAYNNEGTSSTLSLTLYTKPATPTSFTKTQLSDNEVRLSWSDNSNNELGYRIYRNNVLIATLPANSTSYTITNLEAGSTYTYQLLAYNNEGTSSTLSLTLYTKPATPTNFRDTQLSDQGVTLLWSDNSSNETGYKIYQDNILIATLPANTTSYTIKNLEARSTYSYKLLAYNSKGSSSTASLTIETKDDYAWLPAIYHSILY